MAAVLQRELGVKVPYQYVYDYESFFAKCALGDFLDAITVIFKAVEAKGWKQLAAEWLGECRRTMQEENIGYRIDQDGGVHPLVDVEFEINALQLSRFSPGRVTKRHSKHLKARTRCSNATTQIPKRLCATYSVPSKTCSNC
jgi:hypothetical protein